LALGSWLLALGSWLLALGLGLVNHCARQPAPIEDRQRAHH